MSYCATCGGYAAGCAFPGQGRCAPAPNPYEERTVGLLALAVAINARVAAMVSSNHVMMTKQLPPAFGRQHFEELAERLEKELGKDTL